MLSISQAGIFDHVLSACAARVNNLITVILYCHRKCNVVYDKNEEIIRCEVG